MPSKGSNICMTDYDRKGPLWWIRSTTGSHIAWTKQGGSGSDSFNFVAGGQHY